MSVGEIAREATELLTSRISDRDAHIEIGSDLPTLYGDRGHLLQVLQNLIENATKFKHAERPLRIEIDSRRDGADTVLYVKDNGIGIDPQDQEMIFGLFNRCVSGTEGTGFGLALVKRIVELHEGRVWVESAGRGHGSTFCFTWPKKCVRDTADMMPKLHS